MTAEPHRIRLRGFWKQMPAANGQIQHRRAFGRPRSLDAGESVWLVCEQVPGPATVHVNGQILGKITTAGPFAFDITERLLTRNEAVIETLGEIADVSIEIRRG